MTFDKIKEIIAESVNVEEEKIALTSSLKGDLGIDSLDAMELCMAVEEAYGITIEEDALAGFVTVEDIVKYVDENK